MEIETNDIVEETNELEDLELEDTQDTEDSDTTDWKAEAEKARGIAKRLQTKLEKAKKAESKVEKSPEPVVKEAKAEGMDDVESLLLEVKGIQDSEDVALYEKWKSDTSRPPREILNNAIFQKELEAQRAERAVKDATPSNTKRGGGQSDSLEKALAEFEKSGKLPADFDLAAKVTNAFVQKSSGNAPTWRS